MNVLVVFGKELFMNKVYVLNHCSLLLRRHFQHCSYVVAVQVTHLAVDDEEDEDNYGTLFNTSIALNRASNQLEI